MSSILDNRPALAKQIWDIAEVAGYLWQKGWAERNGGNITVNITDYVDEEICTMPALTEPRPIGLAHPAPALRNQYFYCKGTGKRMRDLAKAPMQNGAIIRILDDCASYVIIADQDVAPTSELPAHLLVHNSFLENKTGNKVTLHTHPIELVAMSHNKSFLVKDVLTQLLWSMIPETKAFCPRGLGIVPYQLPGSNDLADATLKELEDYDVVLWEKHGVFAAERNILDAFDQIDVLTKSAQIYMSARNMGFVPEGMSQKQMQEMTNAFHLPK